MSVNQEKVKYNFKNVAWIIEIKCRLIFDFLPETRFAFTSFSIWVFQGLSSYTYKDQEMAQISILGRKG